MARAATHPQYIKTAKRRARVLALRKAGASYREIASAIQKWAADNAQVLPRGWDARYAYKDVKRELDAMRGQMSLDTEAIRQLELERLEDLHRGLWPAAVGQGAVGYDGQLKAIDRLLKIAKQRLSLIPDLDQAATDSVVVRVIGGVDLDAI